MESSAGDKLRVCIETAVDYKIANSSFDFAIGGVWQNAVAVRDSCFQLAVGLAVENHCSSLVRSWCTKVDYIRSDWWGENRSVDVSNLIRNFCSKTFEYPNYSRIYFFEIFIPIFLTQTFSFVETPAGSSLS